MADSMPVKLNFESMEQYMQGITLMQEEEANHEMGAMRIYDVLFTKNETSIEFLESLTFKDFEVAWDNISFAATYEDGICDDDFEMIDALRNSVYQHLLSRELLGTYKGLELAKPDRSEITFI